MDFCWFRLGISFIENKDVAPSVSAHLTYTNDKEKPIMSLLHKGFKSLRTCFWLLFFVPQQLNVILSDVEEDLLLSDP